MVGCDASPDSLTFAALVPSFTTDSPLTSFITDSYVFTNSGGGGHAGCPSFIHDEKIDSGIFGYDDPILKTGGTLVCPAYPKLNPVGNPDVAGIEAPGYGLRSGNTRSCISRSLKSYTIPRECGT